MTMQICEQTGNKPGGRWWKATTKSWLVILAAVLLTGLTTVAPAGAAIQPADCTLSGPSWVSQFPTSTSLSSLAPTFQTDVSNFINAMQQAGITVSIDATRRPLQRAYLMHYAYTIANGTDAAPNVPAFVPVKSQPAVDICWVHTDANGNYDPTASITAAQQMLTAYGISSNLKVPPALKSLHTRGEAIDMKTVWSGKSITINDASGNAVTIDARPHSGLNSTLISVGATYGVIHFINGAKDPNHWSVNGH